ncbi:MAG: FAD:protein FMN transferase [Acidimicrobiia bacterium]
MTAQAPVATNFRAMGTDVTVLVLDGPSDAGARAADAIERLEQLWSRFRPTSELCALNAAGSVPEWRSGSSSPVVVSAETFALVERAVPPWPTPRGRDPPPRLPAVIAAGYDRDFDRVASEGAGPSADPAPAPGCAGIVLDARVSALTLPPGVALDLGGIGKGYAADLVARELVDHGASGALVNLGGDLRAIGAAPEPHGWVVAVDDQLETGATGMLALSEGAIATSTRLRRAWERDGHVLHHLIDPRTGLPAASGLASVTVVDGEAWRAEVLAKAAFIAGSADGRGLIADGGATGLLVYDDGRVEELDGLAAFRP